MNISVIDQKNVAISVAAKVLKVGDRKIPLRLIDTLLITADTHITTADLLRITRENVSILLFAPSLHNGKRTKQPPKDPVNAMLSFGYTILHKIITIRLIALGFEPAIGFLHRPFRSHDALASDLMELFRASINEFVYQIFHNEQLKAEDFTKNSGGVYLRFESRKQLWKDLLAFIHHLQPRVDAAISQIRSML